MLYWLWESGIPKSLQYELDLLFAGWSFKRLSEAYPTATLWGSAPSWHDVIQGGVGNCYIVAAMASLTEFPDMVKSAFISQENNAVGIYAVRFFIRGKPWIVTVDDIVPFKNDEPIYARLGKNNQKWALIMEKAYSKIKGYYSATSGGYNEEAKRSLLGNPIFGYSFSLYTADTVWTFMNDCDNKKYILGFGTSGSSDTTYNSCGLPNAHAYSVIATFTMIEGAVNKKMYMVRNPWGNMGRSSYTGDWRSSDPAWTSGLKAQVPFGIDPTTSESEGIFFVDSDAAKTCFYDFSVAHARDSEGYSDNWYD